MQVRLLGWDMRPLVARIPSSVLPKAVDGAAESVGRHLPLDKRIEEGRARPSALPRRMLSPLAGAAKASIRFGVRYRRCLEPLALAATGAIQIDCLGEHGRRRRRAVRRREREDNLVWRRAPEACEEQRHPAGPASWDFRQSVVHNIRHAAHMAAAAVAAYQTSPSAKSCPVKARNERTTRGDRPSTANSANRNIPHAITDRPGVATRAQDDNSLINQPSSPYT